MKSRAECPSQKKMMKIQKKKKMKMMNLNRHILQWQVSSSFFLYI